MEGGMNIQEARDLHCRLTMEVDRWRAEFWHCHNDSRGEDWDTILKTVERLQRELLALKEITDRRLTDENSVIFGD
jgi:hypothetical protein